MHLATSAQLQQGKVTAVGVLLRIIIIIIVFYTPRTISASMLSLRLILRATFSVGSQRPLR